MTEVDNLVSNRGNQKKNKKQSPQEAWMELLQSSVSSAPPTVKSHLQQMIQLDNVPRKEKQFRNFASNSLNLRGNSAKKILDAIWNHLNEQREKQKKAKEQQQQAAAQQKVREQEKQSITENENQSTPEESKETNNISDSENNPSKESNGDKPNDKDEKAMYKNVKKTTKKLLKKAPNHSMKYKSLQKAVREKLGADKNKLKRIMEKVVAKETRKFLLEGKQLKLVVT